MKIYTVTKDFKSSVDGLFKKVGDVELLPTDYRNIPDFSADLIIFTGGEDINPKNYGVDSLDSLYYNEIRDTWELKVMKDILTRKLKTTKVLGICRGLQLINVAFGGMLYQDIFSVFGFSHEPVHEILHTTRGHAFEFITKVNSMHHQGLLKYSGIPGYNCKVLAVEPDTRVPEIVVWGNSILGFQFHPEFFSDSNEYKFKIAETIKEWCNNKNFSILQKEIPRVDKYGPIVFESKDIASGGIRWETQREAVQHGSWTTTTNTTNDSSF